MIVEFSFPIADLRSFDAEARKSRVPHPLALNASVGDFLHRTGALKQRRALKGDLERDPLFCNARRAVRLPEHFGQDTAHGRVHCIFRRYTYTGEGPAHFDIGFLRPRRQEAPVDALALVSDLMNTALRFQNATGHKRNEGEHGRTKLFWCGSKAAEHLRDATTTRLSLAQRKVPAPDWWCTSSMPLVIVEHEYDELARPVGCREIRLPSKDFAVSAHEIKVDDHSVTVWFIERGGAPGDRRADILRRHLIRSHSYVTMARALTGALLNDCVAVSRGSKETNDLQAFFDEAGKMLKRSLPAPFDFFTHKDISDVMACKVLLTQEEERELSSRIETFRLNVRRKIDTIVQIGVGLIAVQDSPGATVTANSVAS